VSEEDHKDPSEGKPTGARQTLRQAAEPAPQSRGPKEVKGVNRDTCFTLSFNGWP
jgi:hypothetical protein